MASFKNKRKEDIATAKVITHLPLFTSDDEDISPSGDSSTWRCAFSPDETYFAWSCGNSRVTLVFWDRLRQAPALEEGKNNNLHKKPITIYTRFKIHSIAFGCTDKNSILKAWWSKFSVLKNLVLATGHSNGHIRTWDVVKGNIMLYLIDHQDAVTDLSFATNGGSLLLLSSSSDCTLKIWNIIDNGNMYKTVKTSKPVTACSWSPNGKLIVSIGGNMVDIWETENFLYKITLKGHNQKIVSCKFSSDSNLIATASSDTRVILWQVQTGRILYTFGHLFPPPSMFSTPGKDGTWIRDLSFCQDGIHIATVAEDGYVRFWNILANVEDPEVIGETDDAVCCAYSPSGLVLAVGSSNGIMTFWKTDTEVRSLRHICRLAVTEYLHSVHVDKLLLPKLLKDYILYK